MALRELHRISNYRKRQAGGVVLPQHQDVIDLRFIRGLGNRIKEQRSCQIL